jgi:hypothetical protein
MDSTTDIDAVVPDIIYERRPPTVKWLTLFNRLGDYFQAGIQVIAFADEQNGTLTVFDADAAPKILRYSRLSGGDGK